MVIVWPAIVMVPVRTAPAFDATLYMTVPFPVPDAPLTTVIQLALLTAVQLHPAVAVTATEPLPPALPIDWVVGLMLKLQDEAAAS